MLVEKTGKIEGVPRRGASFRRLYYIRIFYVSRRYIAEKARTLFK